jgi:hypothetical protein
LEVIEIEDRQRQRAPGRRAAVDHLLRQSEEAAPVRDVGQRIELGGTHVPALEALLGHGDQNEGGAEGVEQRLEHAEGEIRNLDQMGPVLRHVDQRQGDADEADEAMGREQRHRRPAAHQPVVPAAPQLPRAQRRICRRYDRDRYDAARHRHVEGRHAAGEEPQDAARQRIGEGRAAVVEPAQAAPHRAGSHQEERVREGDAQQVGDLVAQGEQRRAEGAACVGHGPPGERRDRPVLQPREAQHEARQGGEEHGDDEHGRHVDVHRMFHDPAAIHGADGTQPIRDHLPVRLASESQECRFWPTC